MHRWILLFVLSAWMFTGPVISLESQPLPNYHLIRSAARPQYDFPWGLAWENETIWIAYMGYHSLEQIDPYRDVHLKTVPLPKPVFGCTDLTFDGTKLWALRGATPTPDSVLTIDPKSGKTLATLAIPFKAGHLHGMAWDGFNLLMGEWGGVIYRIDPVKWAVVSTIKLAVQEPENPWGLTWDAREKCIWAGYWKSGAIVKIDPATGKELARYVSPYGSKQSGVIHDGWHLWAVGEAPSTSKVSQLDYTEPYLQLVGMLKSGVKLNFNLWDYKGRENGNLFVVGWSGSGTQGFRVGGRTVPLTYDSFTVLGLQLLPVFSGVINNRYYGSTPKFTWPAVPKGIPFWICCVTMNTTGIVSVTEPVKYLSE